MLDALLESLKDYSSIFAEDDIIKQSFITYVMEHPNCLSRDCLPGHLTASAWVLSKQNFNRVLLLKHRKLNLWLQPGGHADGDANLVNVAIKELFEETGLQLEPSSQQIFDLSIHKIPAHFDMPEHFHYDVRYLFTADKESGLRLSSESTAVQWFDFSELKGLGSDDSIIKLAAKSPGWLR